MTPQIATRLIEHGQTLFKATPRKVAFTKNPAADTLLNDLRGHPHAFVLACTMDRQISAERAWLIPYLVSQKLRGFSFTTLRELSLREIRKLLTKPEPLHRFTDIMPQVFHAAIQHIADEYRGDASGIWRDRPSSARVVFRFLQFRGVGPKIATMATNILARNFKIAFADYYSIDVSADIHVRRVFGRLGLVKEGAPLEDIIYCARALNPEFPGLLDFPAWEIGRKWCRPTEPLCDECYMKSDCPTGKAASLSAG
jgi:hypothetical protein